MSKFNNIVKVRYKKKCGSAFVLPALNKKCMFLITAHHVLNNDINIEFDKIKISNFDDKEIALDFYNDKFYYDSEKDFCVLKINYKNEFLFSTIALPYPKETLELIGFPKCLSETQLKQHSLSCDFYGINNDNIIFATISSSIQNYETEEHKLIEGFSGGPFVHEKDGVLYFLGIENKTVTENTSYNMVQGVSGKYIAEEIYFHFYKGNETSFESVFNMQTLDVHKISVSDENDILEFRKTIKRSKISINIIDDVLGENYEIDRSKILKKIRESNSKFVSLTGDAGSGKTALAKKLVFGQEFLLYARAEQFAQKDNIYDIWNFDIEKISDILKSKKIIIFIDALEFIADKTGRLKNLEQLFEIADKSNNIRIITTCRTSDKSAFLRIESKYNVTSFEIEAISQKELSGIKSKFPIISKLNDEKYSQLLKSPFYINLIIKSNFIVSDIKDENSFREKIFNEVICLKEKCSRYNISYDNIVSTVNMIAFKRAKEFLLGIHKDEIHADVLKALESEGVIIEKDSYVRLQYDIFEDIVFEREFDKEFINCRGDFKQFYTSITEYGKCVYRRYQIWIANKLFINKARDRFINELLFSDTIDSEWKEQTIIGIVKSKYCIDFFNEYENDLIENKILEMFIEVINLYSFSPKINNDLYLQLIPMGIARGKIIDIIQKKGLYGKEDLDENSIIKLCDDYSQSQDTKSEFSDSACKIIESLINKRVNKSGDSWYYSSKLEVCPLLGILYRLADSCKSWIDNYFDKLIQYFKGENSHEKRFASDVAEYTMQNTSCLLVKNNIEKLSELANQFWVFKDKPYYLYSDYNESYKYGLNENAENYRFHFKSPLNNLFYLCTLKVNFKFALNWTINFINEAMECFFKDYPKEDCTIKIHFFGESDNTNYYYAKEDFWLMGVQEHNEQVLLSDMIYMLKEFLIARLEVYKEEKDIFIRLANFVRDSIYAKSNNIALLTIIEAIGLHFIEELPGYALDLASSMELIYFDIRRYMLYIPNKTIDLLKKQIFSSIGISSSLIKERYLLDKKCNRSLQEYVLFNGVFYKEQKERCNSICDYLYNKFPDSSDNSEYIFQIQKMDERKAIIKNVGKGLIAVDTEIDGNAEVVIKENNKAKSEVIIMLKKCVPDKKEEIDINHINKTINYIIKHSSLEESFRIEFEQWLIILICFLLENESTSLERKNELCNVLLDKLFGIFDNHYPIIEEKEEKMVIVLLKQLKLDVSLDIKNRIKRFILFCLTKNNNNNIIDNYIQIINMFFNNNKDIAKLYFVTLTKLSEKEKNESYDKIIEKYLINEQEPEQFIVAGMEYDFDKLALVTECGLDVDDNDFCTIIQLLLKMTNSRFQINHDYEGENINSYTSYRIISCLQKELKQKEYFKRIIDIIFDTICISNMSRNELEFYYEIFNYTLSSYFDGSKVKNLRQDVQNVLEYLEQKISSIQDEKMRIQLSKPLILYGGKYGCGDWSKLITNYSIKDKKFLNIQIENFGKYYFNDVLYSLYQLQIKELLPDILLSINSCMKAMTDKKGTNALLMEKNNKLILENIIFNAFKSFSDEIKENKQISDAFESILNILINHRYEKAAVILDEYRIH